MTHTTEDLERPAWGVWVDYKIAPPGSYACLVSRFMDNRWTDPEPQWMPAQLRPQLYGEVKVMPYLMPNDPLAAVNAVPELVAIKAERDRAQRACEQMGARITSLEAALKPFSDKAHYWLERDDIHGLDDDDECATEIRFGDLRRARAALNQEPGQ